MQADTMNRFYTDRAARALATTRLRAETLFIDGYRAEPTEAPGVYQVHQPEGRRLGKGQQPYYCVDVNNQTCDCVAFDRFNECKHLSGLNARVREALAFLAPLLPAAVPAAEPPDAPVRGFSSRAAFVKSRAADYD